PGLLVPIDLLGLLLLSLVQQKIPERQVESFDYHVYGSFTLDSQFVYARQLLSSDKYWFGQR
ncbi:MAG: hypothetical protein ACKOD7_06640, partial [Polynucleobacter victoriensis]